MHVMFLKCYMIFQTVLAGTFFNILLLLQKQILGFPIEEDKL